MAELASLSGRRTAQRRITNNRDGVLPARRNTDAPGVAVRADLRAATRGDGGADELRRTLDQFTNSVGAFGQARNAADGDRFRAEAGAGAADAVAGVDPTPEQLQSRAYTEAYYNVKAEASFNAFSAETRAAVDEALNQGMGPDEVEAMVVERTTAYWEGVRETVPPSSWVETAGRLSKLATDLDGTVATRIRERTQEEATTTAQGNIQSRLRAGEDVDFEGYVATFRQFGIAPAAAKKNAIDAILAVALDREDPQPELLSRLLTSTQADGVTPSLSASEQLMVQDRLTQATNLQTQREREVREERRDALVQEWFVKAVDGEIVDEQIIQAGREGILEPQEVSTYLGLTNGLRDKVEEGHVDEDFVLQVSRDAALGRPPSNAQVLAWEREGRFGTGRAAARAALQFLSDNASASAARRAAGRGQNGSYLSASETGNRNISTARSYLWDQLDPGEGATAYQGQMRIHADREFNRRVMAGEDPLAVADSLATSFRPYIDGRRGATSRPSTQTRSSTAAPRVLRYGADGQPIR